MTRLRSARVSDMYRMSFSVDPGPLPFETIRLRRKWGERLRCGDCIIIYGHWRDGDKCVRMTKVGHVAGVLRFDGLCPARLFHLYGNAELVRIQLEPCPHEHPA